MLDVVHHSFVPPIVPPFVLAEGVVGLLHMLPGEWQDLEGPLRYVSFIPLFLNSVEAQLIILSRVIQA